MDLHHREALVDVPYPGETEPLLTYLTLPRTILLLWMGRTELGPVSPGTPCSP